MEITSDAVAGLGGALLGALITAIFAWKIQRAQQMDAYKREFQSALTKLLEIQEIHQIEVDKITDYGVREARSGFLNTKRNVLLETAEFLAQKLGNLVAPSEYNVLATQQMLNSNFEAAERAFHDASRSANARPSRIGQAVAYRSLGYFYFSEGPILNYEKGRLYFKQASDALSGSLDPYSIYSLGYTHEVWGVGEWWNGFTDEGRRLTSYARKYYNDLPEAYNLKGTALAQLEVRIRSLQQGQNPGEAAPPQIEPQITIADGPLSAPIRDAAR